MYSEAVSTYLLDGKKAEYTYKLTSSLSNCYTDGNVAGVEASVILTKDECTIKVAENGTVTINGETAKTSFAS